MELLNTVNVVLQIFSNICIVGITLYTAYLQFWCKSIKVLSYSSLKSRFYGETITLYLKNKSLSSVSIARIYLVFNNKSHILFKEFETPLLVDGRCSFQVKMEGISKPIPELKEVPYNQRLLVIEFTEGYCISTFGRTKWKNMIYSMLERCILFRKKYTINDFYETRNITVNRIKFEDKYLSENVKYVLYVKSESTTKTIFIDKDGYMSEVCFDSGKWCNGVGKGNYNEIKSKISEAFKGQDISYELYDIREQRSF